LVAGLGKVFSLSLKLFHLTNYCCAGYHLST
jgi:hypothetical protein